MFFLGAINWFLIHRMHQTHYTNIPMIKIVIEDSKMLTRIQIRVHVIKIKKSRFRDATRVCDSSRVSGANVMGMPFRVPIITIPGSAHMEVD
jgi:hypothetical protein